VASTPISGRIEYLRPKRSKRPGKRTRLFMSYHCGLDDRRDGIPGKPHIKCDLCGIEHTIYDPQWKGPIPSIWFLDGLAAPGWHGGRNPDGSRTDYCGECFKAHSEPVLEVEQVPAEALPPQDDTVEEIEAVTRREDLVNSDPRQAELSSSRDYQLELAVIANLGREARGEPYISYGPEHEIQSLTRLVEALDELESLED